MPDAELLVREADPWVPGPGPGELELTEGQVFWGVFAGE